MRRTHAASLLAGLMVLASQGALAEVKIGFMGPLSGPQGVLGQDQYDGFMLGVEMAGGKMGGEPVTVLKEDDQIKPELGAQITRKFIERDRVDAIVGLSATNVLMAARPRIVESGTVAIATNAGPASIAGAQCSPNLFVAAWQSDGPSEAMGKLAQEQGYKRVFLGAPNYQAGKDMLTGFKRFYKGKVVDEVYTQIGQADYSTEITQIQADKPDAVFVFYPGGMGINFAKQLKQAGVLPAMPVFSVFMVDPTTLPAIGDAAVGVTAGAMWDAALDNPANKKFVAAFQQKYKRLPSYYAAAGYDAANILKTAFGAMGPDLHDKAKLAAAVKAAGESFESVRGPFKFNRNNMPIQNYYAFKYVKQGDKIVPQYVATPLKDRQDVYVGACPLK